MKNKTLFILTVSLVLFLTAIFFEEVNAGLSANVTGWGWGGGAESFPGDTSHTNFGWVSMNSINCDTNGDGTIGGGDTPPVGCPLGIVGDYGIDIPSTDTNVSGYAWSENIGWVDFEPIAPYPGLPNYSVKRNGNNLEGWARIVSIQTASGIGNSGGWSGWIKMSGTAQDGLSYVVEIDKMDGTGTNPTYAWSDELGWIDFSRSVYTPTDTLKICLNSCNSGAMRASSSASGTATLMEGNSENLVACFNDVNDCTDSTGNITVDPGTVWLDTGAPNDAITLSGTDPRVVTGSLISSNQQEILNISHNDGTNIHTAHIVYNIINVVTCGDSNVEGAEECDCVPDGACQGSCGVGEICSSCKCKLVREGSPWKEVAQ